MLVGIIFIFLASVAFGAGPVFAKELIDMGYSTWDILLYPKISILLIIGVIFIIRRVSLRVTKTQLWQLILLCAASNGLTAVLLVSAYRFLPIGLATMFHFIYPVVVTVFMAVIFKERISILKAFAIVIAITGLCFILDLSGNMSFIGVILALSSGFAYAIYVIANRKSAYKDLPALIIVFYSTIINFLAVIVYQIVWGRVFIPSTGLEWFLITGNGLISGLFAFFMLILGIRRIGASNAAIANMFEPMTALVAGAVLFGDRIETKALVGCILVLLAILLITVNKSSRLTSGKEPDDSETSTR